MQSGTIEKYTLLEDSYNGSGGFESGDYLRQHTREKADTFAKRRDLSYFLNYVSPVVNSHVDPIFKTAPTREATGGASAAYQEFIDDCDAGGSGLDAFMKLSARYAKLFGSCFIVVDNFRDQPGTEAELMAQRKFPYVYVVLPQAVSKITTDSHGNLTYFQYREKDDDGEKFRTWTTTSWVLSEFSELGKGVTYAEGEHGLGVVPVARLYARQPEKTKPLGFPEFLSVARTNLRIFNLCSEIDEIARNQTFPLLTLPSEMKDTKTIGTSNALGFDGEKSHFAPAYIAPPSEPIVALREWRGELVQEIYRMAMMSHATGVESKTGIAIQLDYAKTNIALADFAHNLIECEYQIATIFSLWTGKELNADIQYKSDFSFRDTAQMLTEIISAVDFGASGLFLASLKKKAAKTMLDDVPQDELDAVIEEIDADAEKPEPVIPPAVKAVYKEEIQNIDKDATE